MDDETSVFSAHLCVLCGEKNLTAESLKRLRFSQPQPKNKESAKEKN
jgi:hypothetical protein